MTRADLILDCRYYNGEEEVPDTLPKGKEIFWDYERVWVKWVLEGYPNLQKSIDHYTEAYDLPNLLPENDGTRIAAHVGLLPLQEAGGGRRTKAHHAAAD